ncbi:DUF4347 domain-containing protein, partial [Pseudomonas sp. BN417]|uniref:Ig-like domain-containing protein n=1 Tax=Pseudomonas sp. BN417 TaxID=2567890 RepID=UPI002457686A
MWWNRTAPEKSSNPPARSALAVALEPRMMFDGAVAATAVEVADAQPAADAADNQASTHDASSSSDTLAATPAGTADNRQEVVFVDSQVKDYQQLVNGLKPGTEVVVLDANKDGLQQIADYLGGRSGIDAIHILSHGDVGKVQLGNDWLEGGDLATRSGLLNAIGQSMGSDGDILLYGCQVGANGEGQAFIDGLASATGADVAASSDLTGAVSKGGDWELESRSGLVESSAMGVAGYQHLLLAPADENYDDDSGQSFSNTAVFNFDGVKYTITGTAGNSYSSVISNDSFSPLGNGGTDYYLLFDSVGLNGISSIKIEALDGSAFRLLGLSIDGIADADISITPNGGSAVNFASNGSFVTSENFSFSANTQFHNITSFTISGGNLLLNLDDLNFDAPQVAPTLTSATVADTNLKAGETSLVTFTFNTAVSGFTTADLTVANGSITGLSSSNGGLTWTGTLTPTADTTDPTNLITVNLAGVTSVSTGTAGSGTASSNNYAIDTERPTATIVVADSALRVGETSLVTITFSESVSGLTNADLTIANGTLTAVSSSDGGITWTGTFTPSASITDTTNLITLDNTGIADLAGNAGSGTTDSNNYAIDTVRPTATIVVADSALSAGETSLVTITFSEAVSGFTNADLTIANGTLSAVSSSDGGITWTATFTPTDGISDASNLITLNNTGISDLAGNTGSGTTDSGNYVINTAHPTATIVVADNALRIGETSL